MLQTLYFLLVAVTLYFAADCALDRIERARGARLEHRGVVFFAILLALAVVVFGILRILIGD